MPELTTDQRLASLLLPTISELGEQYRVTQQNIRTLREQGDETAHVVEVQEHVRDRYGETVDRLGELVEALAAGTVRIMSDTGFLQVIERVVEDDRRRQAGAMVSPARVAELALESMKKEGVIR